MAPNFVNSSLHFSFVVVSIIKYSSRVNNELCVYSSSNFEKCELGRFLQARVYMCVCLSIRDCFPSVFRFVGDPDTRQKKKKSSYETLQASQTEEERVLLYQEMYIYCSIQFKKKKKKNKRSVLNS